MKKSILSLAAAALFLLSGCSSKEVFEPQSVKGDWENYSEFDTPIIDTTSNVALLDNRLVLDKEGNVNNIIVEDGYRLISKSDGWIISSSIDGKIKLKFLGDESLTKEYDLKKTIASASIKDDLLAVLFADNEMGLYKVSTGELLLKEHGEAPTAVDSRIVNPYFMNDLILFSTLDGKIVIINSKERKKLRTVIVSTEKNFNNIIYFDVADNKLIIATPNNLMSMSQKEFRSKYEIRNVAYDYKDIYITTKQGEVVNLSADLVEKAKVKFPFAHFLGVIIGDDKVYALEKEGYIIELDKDLAEHKIYEVDIDDGYVFVGDKVFYVNDIAISVDAQDQ